MGVWDVSTIYSDDASFVKSGDLGLAPFPTVPGGTGNVGDLEGNTSVYSILAVAPHQGPDICRRAVHEVSSTRRAMRNI